MWPYWLMFLVPAAAAVGLRRPVKPGTYGRWSAEWFALASCLTLLVGFRYEVGGDWGQYQRLLDEVQYDTLLYSIKLSDPGYMLVSWLSAQAGWGIYGVNLFCGAVFSAGLVSFCLRLPRPWLAVAVAVPYLLVVVAMGYSRQGVALGFVLLGLAALRKQSVARFVIWVMLGSAFHKSAVLVLPLAAIAAGRNRYWTACWVAVAAALCYFVLLQDSVDALYENYVEAEYQSEGALIRLLMNVLPAGLLIFKHKRLNVPAPELRLWRWFALLSCALFLVLFFTSASTAVDRVALYLLPLQLMVFSHLPDLVGSRQRHNESIALVVLLYYAIVLFVWLNFATHSRFWIPYRFFPLELLQS